MKNTAHIIPPLFGASPSLLRFRTWAFLLSAAAILTLLLSTASSSFAGSATWQASPPTRGWNHAANWTPTTIPNGPSDTATFATSNKTGVSISANTEVNGIVFNAAAAANPFTITVPNGLTLTMSGAGITNNSGVIQNFGNFGTQTGAPNLSFTNIATAGSMTVITNHEATVSGKFGSITQFDDTSTAGSATIINNSGMVSGVILSAARTQFNSSSTAGSSTITDNGATVSGAGAGFLLFTNSSTAGSATITNNGATAGGTFGGLINFDNTSSAGSATISNNGSALSGAFTGGGTVFIDSSTANAATLIANGGTAGGTGGRIFLDANSDGGTARMEVFGNGKLDISGHNAPGVTIGSIEGTGAVFLGANNLTVGSNNLDTTFSGVIQDGGAQGGTGGSLTKTGDGKLVLTGVNTYTGGSVIDNGKLLVGNASGSGTGNGPVQVNAGTLAGTGKISGAVTVGNGTTSGATLLAGNSATKPGNLTINNTLTFNSPATYECVLKRATPKAGKVSALGVTINSGATFTFVDVGTGTLTANTVFTVINNTSANPIVGTFSNLANNSTFTSKGTTFKASYTGGTGNDLTLTVQ